ncbi:MAG: hypothetical protein ACHQVS_00005, partial [Candidatus Babeliales bacterium]
GFGGVAFLYTLVHGSHPVITGFFGCLTFAPYSEIKAQINRCFNHKRPGRHHERDLEAAKALIKVN